MSVICRQTQWDPPTWDVMADDEDDMDLGTPTNDEIRVSFVSAVAECLFLRLHGHQLVYTLATPC